MKKTNTNLCLPDEFRNTENKTERLTIRISKNTMNILKNIAKDNNMKIGKVARSFIKYGCDNYTQFWDNI